MMPEYMRVGIRLFRQTDSHKHSPMVAMLTEVYDLDNGRLLPIEVVNLHFSPDSVVTATLKVEIHDVKVMDTD